LKKKNQKKLFFGYICTGSNTLFLDLKNFLATFGTLYYLQKQIKNKVSKGTKYGESPGFEKLTFKHPILQSSQKKTL
jgi:hypothetical protein